MRHFFAPASIPIRLVFAIGLLGAVDACTSKAVAPDPTPQAVSPPVVIATSAPAPNAQWAAYLRQFEEEYFVANPDFAVTQGRHEFDGQLPDWSPEGIHKKIDQLVAARAKAQDFADLELSSQECFERDYLLAVIDRDLFWIRDVGEPFKNPSFYTGGLEPSVYLTRPYAPLEVRMKAFIAYAKAIPAATAQIRANLKTPLPKTFVTLGVNGFGGFPSFYRKDVPKIFADVKDPRLQAELKAAIGPAAKSMQALANWLNSQRSNANDDYALGPQKFAAMLYMTERVDTPLADLEAIAKGDLDRNLAALKNACAEFAPGTTLRVCVDKVEADKPVGGAVEGARAQLSGLRQFIVDHNVVSIPSDEQALVAEAPPYQRWNFAYIDIAGPYDKGMPSVYNIAPPDPTWSKADQAAYMPGRSILLFTSAHEVWPGHFLQFLHSNRSTFIFGQVFVGYAFAEGWAHYSEQMMWDAGLGSGRPEVHIGQLSEALLRNVRFVCAIGLHTQGMSVKTCETMFREQAFQDPGNARQQAARGTYDPAYLNYTMGKLMIMKLRTDWLAAQGADSGGDGRWKAFHDQFLSYGGPPIPLVRAQMLGSAGGTLF